MCPTTRIGTCRHSYSYTQTYTQTLIHTSIHRCPHSHTAHTQDAHPHSLHRHRAHKGSHTDTQAHTHLGLQIINSSYTQGHTRVHTGTHTHVHRYSYTHSYPHRHTPTDTCTGPHSQRDAHAHTHTHTDTQSHTPPSLPPFQHTIPLPNLCALCLSTLPLITLRFLDCILVCPTHSTASSLKAGTLF